MLQPLTAKSLKVWWRFLSSSWSPENLPIINAGKIFNLSIIQSVGNILKKWKLG